VVSDRTDSEDLLKSKMVTIDETIENAETTFTEKTPRAGNKLRENLLGGDAIPTQNAAAKTVEDICSELTKAAISGQK